MATVFVFAAVARQRPLGDTIPPLKMIIKSVPGPTHYIMIILSSKERTNCGGWETSIWNVYADSCRLRT